MELPLSVELKKRALRTGLYVLGFAAILFLICSIIFVLFLPKLRGMAEKEMYKYGVEAQNMEVGALGGVSMQALSLPLEKGGFLRVDSVSMRPPVRFLGKTWVGGSGTFYNVRLEKDKLQLIIPELDFAGLSLGEKDPKISSHSLQMLQRLQAGRLYADKVYIKMADNAPATVKTDAIAAMAAGQEPPISASDAKDASSFQGASAAGQSHFEITVSGLDVSGLRGGKISELSYNAMEGSAYFAEQIEQGAGEQQKQDQQKQAGNIGSVSSPALAQLFLHGAGFGVEDLDATALFALAKSLLPLSKDDPQFAEKRAEYASLANVGELIGKVWLRNLHFVLETAKLGTVRLDMAALNSNGFALKPHTDLRKLIFDAPNEISKPAGKNKNQSAAAQADSELEKRKLVVNNIRQIIANIASIDIKIQDLRADVSPNAGSLANAAAKNAAMEAQVTEQRNTAAKDEGEKTISDVLSAEQALEKQKRRLEYTPPHFKLSVADFALTSGHWEQLIPYNFYVKMQNLIYSPQNPESTLSQFLQQIGKQDLRLSLLGDIAWRSSDLSLNVNKVTASGPDMGSFSMQGKMLNIPKRFFSGDADSMEQTLNAGVLKSLELRMKDDGFIKNIVQWGTSQIDISPKELQSVIYDIAVKSPPLLLKNGREAQNISNILGDFVNHSGSVRIMLNAPEGIRINDIMAAQDDMAGVMSKIQITADRTPPDN